MPEANSIPPSPPVIPTALLLKPEEKQKDRRRPRPPQQPHLKPGDIVLIQSDGFIGWSIRQKSRLKGEPPTRVNHAAMVIAVPDFIIDAQPPRVTVDSLMDTYGPCGDRIGIYRLKSLSEEQRMAIAKRALKYDARPYGFGKIVLQWFGLSSWIFADGYPICSYLVARPYAEIAGWEFGIPAKQAQPDDIDDHIHANPDLYQTMRKLTSCDADW